MSDEATPPLAPPAVVEEAVEAPKARSGWIKSTDGRFHEVDDIDLALSAYPGQYEEVKASEVKKTLVGWPSEEG